MRVMDEPSTRKIAPESLSDLMAQGVVLLSVAEATPYLFGKQLSSAQARHRIRTGAWPINAVPVERDGNRLVVRTIDVSRYMTTPSTDLDRAADQRAHSRV